VKSFLTLLERQPTHSIFLIAICTVFLTGLMDHFIGPELSSAIFYVLPIALASWFGTLRGGISIGILSAIIWLITDISSGREYSSAIIVYWNAAVRLGIFLIIAFLFSSFRERMLIEELAADTDSLTGIANARGFYEQLDFHALYARRYDHSLTLAYIDLDNFKPVNDTLGHTEGDSLLIAVTQTLKDHIRNTDVAARLGGDEFAVLLTGTAYSPADIAFRNTHQQLLERMKKNEWSVTFSIGMVTFNKIPEHPREMIKMVDELMYSVKKREKNALFHITWPVGEG